MSKRAWLAGIVAGVAMFFWMSIAHMVLPFGTIGVNQVPDDPAFVDAMKTSLGGAAGLYLFPSMGVPTNASRAEMRAAMDKYSAKLASNPSGVLIYNPPGMKVFTPSQLGTEFFVELLEAVLAVWLLTRTRLAGFGGRVAFVAVLGLVAILTTNISYWNWYHFPTNYTLGYMATQWLGYLVAGIVAATLLKGQPAALAARA